MTTINGKKRKPPSCRNFSAVFRFTRYPKDEDPFISTSLGIPGYDPAQVVADENEIEEYLVKGYVAPVAKLFGKTGTEFDSFLSNVCSIFCAVFFLTFVHVDLRNCS